MSNDDARPEWGRAFFLGAPRLAVFSSLAAVQVMFGLHYLAAKVLLEEIPPRAWALMRVWAAAALLLVACRVFGHRLPTSPAVLGRLALYSILGVVINQLCFVEGLSRTTPTHSSIINTSIPVGTLLFAVLLGREKLEGKKLFSLAIGFAGVALIIRPTAGPLQGEVQLGDLLTLINALSYALFLVLSKRLMSRVDALAATAVLFLFGGLGMSIPGLPVLVTFDPGAVSLRGWGLALFIVLVPTAAAYALTYWALARVESSVVGLFIYLQPVVATTLSLLLFAERPEPLVFGGAALIFLAAYLSLRPAGSAAPPRAGKRRARAAPRRPGLD